MIQVYLLTEIYLILSALLLLLDFYRSELSFLLTLRHLIITSFRLRTGLFVAGLVLALLQLIFPIDPGPRFLGDLIPALATLLVAFWYNGFGKEDVKKSRISGSGRTRGYLLLALALIHFLFPMAVLF